MPPQRDPRTFQRPCPANDAHSERFRPPNYAGVGNLAVYAVTERDRRKRRDSTWTYARRNNTLVRVDNNIIMITQCATRIIREHNMIQMLHGSRDPNARTTVVLFFSRTDGI